MKRIYLLFTVLLLASCQTVQEQQTVDEEPREATGDDFELSKAAWEGDIERVEELIASGADVESWSNLGSHSHTPLMYAVYKGHYEIAEMLIEAGADVNAAHDTTHTVLYHALESYQVSPVVIQLLVDEGVRMDYTPLLWAMESPVSNEIPQILAILIEAGADVNKRDRNGTTVLINAVKSRKIECVDTLLRFDADIDATDESTGRSALAWAVAMSAPKTVQRLIEAGADLRVRDESGNTPLMIAKSNGSEEIVKLLIDAGATR
jgi:ankyrin repeat protein